MRTYLIAVVSMTTMIGIGACRGAPSDSIAAATEGMTTENQGDGETSNADASIPPGNTLPVQSIEEIVGA